MVKVTLPVLVASLATTAHGIKDGNPKMWDRVRRCDDDYGVNPDAANPYDTEVCGLCEGIGGEAWSDDLADFVPAACTPVLSAADGAVPVADAFWAGTFTADLEEIMINECKVDAGGRCDFPGPDSTTEHEYVRQAGKWHMDFDPNGRVLFQYDYVEDAYEAPMTNNPGRVSPTDIYHYPQTMIEDVPKDMFINVIGAIGPIDLCICVSPGIGPITNDHMLSKPEDITSINSTYPVAYIGVEILDIEYQGANLTTVQKEVDHWVKGPHHIFVNRETDDESFGKVIRGWQPWNALQIFTNYRDLEAVGLAKLDAGPTAISACNNPPFPGITCDKESTKADRTATGAYVSRAERKVPGSPFKANSFEEMADKLNVHLTTLLADTAGHAECSAFSVDELNDVMRMVNAARDAALDRIYQREMDPRRVVHNGVMGLEKRFARESELLQAAPELETMVRDGKCHEIVMWFIHHLSQESQKEVANLVALPFLPRVRHFLPKYASSAHAEIANSYEDEISCADCHLASGVLNRAL